MRETWHAFVTTFNLGFSIQILNWLDGNLLVYISKVIPCQTQLAHWDRLP